MGASEGEWEGEREKENEIWSFKLKGSGFWKKTLHSIKSLPKEQSCVPGGRVKRETRSTEAKQPAV